MENVGTTPTSKKTWSVGTLKYTLPQLLITATLLLFAKQMMCTVCYTLVPTINPLH